MPQAVPHAPQWSGSAEVSTHASPQRVWPEGHTQRPIEHTEPFEHAVPHAPQLALSLWRSTHAPMQAMRPVVHIVWHVPELHT